MHMSSHIAPPYYIPPIQLQSFGNTQVPMPKESESIGGQSYPEWAEIEKKLKANGIGGQSCPGWAELEKKLKAKSSARRLEQIEKELAQRKEALPIDEKSDDSKIESSSAGKAESTSVCSESIKSKEESTIEKGHGEHITTVLDFSEAK